MPGRRVAATGRIVPPANRRTENDGAEQPGGGLLDFQAFAEQFSLRAGAGASSVPITPAWGCRQAAGLMRLLLTACSGVAGRYFGFFRFVLCGDQLFLGGSSSSQAERRRSGRALPAFICPQEACRAATLAPIGTRSLIV